MANGRRYSLISSLLVFVILGLLLYVLYEKQNSGVVVMMPRSFNGLLFVHDGTPVEKRRDGGKSD